MKIRKEECKKKINFKKKQKIESGKWKVSLRKSCENGEMMEKKSLKEYSFSRENRKMINKYILKV